MTTDICRQMLSDKIHSDRSCLQCNALYRLLNWGFHMIAKSFQCIYFTLIEKLTSLIWIIGSNDPFDILELSWIWYDTISSGRCKMFIWVLKLRIFEDVHRRTKIQMKVKSRASSFSVSVVQKIFGFVEPCKEFGW